MPERISDHILVRVARPDGGYDDRIECVAPETCEGWQECCERHEVDGHNADVGPYDCDTDAPWFDEEEFKFHGVTHTYRYPHGWTVPFQGCIVAHHHRCWGSDVDGIDETTPPGRYPIRAEWDDDECILSLADQAVADA